MGVTGRGSRKKRRAGLKKGHSIRSGYRRVAEKPKKPKPVIRFDQEDHEDNTTCDPEGKITTNGIDGAPMEATILRPRKQETFYQAYDKKSTRTGAGDDNTYSFLHRAKTLELFNTAIEGHQKHSPKCKAPLTWNYSQIQQRGLCWIMGLKCTLCSYTTVKGKKLYHEVPTNRPGRKPAAPNIGLQIALSRQGIGISGMADILNAMNCIAPSLSGMQRAANKVSKFLEAENILDMAGIVQKLKSLNKMKGLPATIQLSSDGMFNIRLCNGFGKTPFQPASRCYYSMAEMLTRAKKIVHARVHQRGCTCRGRAHRPGCTANLDPNATIGNEGQYLNEGLDQLRALGVDVWAITMDGDSNANNVARTRVPKVFTCTRHLSRRTCANIKNKRFTNECFPGYKKEERDKYQSRFALDFSHRLQAELKALAKRYPGNYEAIFEHSRGMDDAVIACYQGDHTACHQVSLVCRPNRPWRRPYLPRTDGGHNPDTLVIDPKPTDVLKLKVAAGMRFNVSALEQTYLDNTQNKCEATNRAIVKSLPKHIEWFRNSPGRLHAAIHQLNNLPGRSLLMLCEAAGCAIAPNSKVTRQLASRDKKVKSDKRRQSLPRYATRRASGRMTRYNDYDKLKPDDCYKTGAYLWGAQKTANLAAYRTRAAKRLRTTATRVVSEHSYSEKPKQQRKNRRI